MDEFVINIDFDNLIKGVEISEKTLHAINRGMELAFEDIKDRLLLMLSANLDKYGLTASRLKNHLVIEETIDGVLIYVDSDYAEFVEYGTGIVGSKNPHPKPINWAYDVNGHGELGWKYVGDDGKLHWTKGMPSRPFMYDTWLWGSQSFTQIYRMHIKREIRRVLH